VYSARDAEVIELASTEEAARLARDPMHRIEVHSSCQVRIADASEQVAELMTLTSARHANGNDIRLNRALKCEMRVRRRDEKASEKRCASCPPNLVCKNTAICAPLPSLRRCSSGCTTSELHR
jgi:hypothetical protein